MFIVELYWLDRLAVPRNEVWLHGRPVEITSQCEELCKTSCAKVMCLGSSHKLTLFDDCFCRKLDSICASKMLRRRELFDVCGTIDFNNTDLDIQKKNILLCRSLTCRYEAAPASLNKQTPQVNAHDMPVDLINELPVDTPCAALLEGIYGDLGEPCVPCGCKEPVGEHISASSHSTLQFVFHGLSLIINQRPYSEGRQVF